MKKLNPAKIKIIKISFYLFFAFLLLLWLTASSISVYKAKNILESKVYKDSLKTEKRLGMLIDTASFNLLKEISFKEALIEMSKQDSIGLIVNLPDSSVQLAINGVIIHTARASVIKNDRLLEKLDPLAQALLFSKPEVITTQFATIVKEPIVVRKAPKDTADARINAWKPDTLIQNPAHLEISFADGIRIVFNQEKNKGFRDWRVKTTFHLIRKLRQTKGNIKNLMNLTFFAYSPEITLDLPVDELRSIYRALPDKAYIVVYF